MDGGLFPEHATGPGAGESACRREGKIGAALRFARVAGVAGAVLYERSAVSRSGQRTGEAVRKLGDCGLDWHQSRDAKRKQSSQIFNSAALVSPQGEWTARYDKVHLVPFGEYLPFPQVFGFAGGLTKEVGEFQHGTSREAAGRGRRAAGNVYLLRVDFSG